MALALALNAFLRSSVDKFLRDLSFSPLTLPAYAAFVKSAYVDALRLALRFTLRRFRETFRETFLLVERLLRDALRAALRRLFAAFFIAIINLILKLLADIFLMSNNIFLNFF